MKKLAVIALIGGCILGSLGSGLAHAGNVFSVEAIQRGAVPQTEATRYTYEWRVTNSTDQPYSNVVVSVVSQNDPVMSIAYGTTPVGAVGPGAMVTVTSEFLVSKAEATPFDLGDLAELYCQVQYEDLFGNAVSEIALCR